MDALSSDLECPEDPGDTNGKTIEEIRAWCTEYERKQKMVRVEPLPTLRRDSTGAPSRGPTKALGKQTALSASKPGTGKQRAGDTFEIDLLSAVITTTATTVKRNKRNHNGQGEQAVRSETNFSAKRAK